MWKYMWYFVRALSTTFLICLLWICKIDHPPQNKIVLLHWREIQSPGSDVISVPPFLLKLEAPVNNLHRIYLCEYLNTVVQADLYSDGYAYIFCLIYFSDEGTNMTCIYSNKIYLTIYSFLEVKLYHFQYHAFHFTLFGVIWFCSIVISWFWWDNNRIYGDLDSSSRKIFKNINCNNCVLDVYSTVSKKQ